MLNTVSLVSIYFFDWLLLPLAQGQQKWLHRNVGWFYQVLWLLPVVGISFYLNVSLRSCDLGCCMSIPSPRRYTHFDETISLPLS